jgi:hypothetical protein
MSLSNHRLARGGSQNNQQRRSAQKRSHIMNDLYYEEHFAQHPGTEATAEEAEALEYWLEHLGL